MITNQIYKEIYLGSEQPDTWADLELQLGKYTYELTVEESEQFLNDFEELNKDLSTYLENVQVLYDVSIEEDFSDVFVETGKKFYVELLPKEKNYLDNFFFNKRDENHKFNFISFNYTNTLDILVTNYSTKNIKNSYQILNYRSELNKSIIKVHGSTDYVLTLGLNDISQLNKDIFEDEDLNDLIKPSILEINRETMQDDAIKTLKNNSIFIIFGMSLGSTDRFWWEKIATFLLNDSNRRLIIHSYQSEGAEMVVPRVVRRRRLAREKDFLSHLKNMNLTEANEKQLREQIYIIFNSKMVFNMDFRKYVNDDSV